MKLAALLICMATAIATGAAAQDCPAAADLRGGVRLTRVDPLLSTVTTRTTAGYEEARVNALNGPPRDVSTVYIHPLAVVRRVDATGALTVAYAEDPNALRDLPQLGRWASPVTLSARGAVIGRGLYTAEFIEIIPVTIGTCTYDTWLVQDTLTLAGRAPIRFAKYYAPGVDLVVQAIRLDPAGTSISTVQFDEIRAERP